jgi:hypothetical protein
VFGIGAIEVLLVLVLLLGVAVVGVVVVAVLVSSSRPQAALSPGLVAARRHAVTTSGLSLVLLLTTPVLLLVAVTAATAVDLGIGPSYRLLACAPLLGALLALLVLLVGELTWPRPTGSSRTALLQDRSVRSLLGRGWPLWGSVTVALTLLLLVVAGLVGDDTGATLTRVRADGSDTAGPFPGWTYGVPQLAVLTACLVLALATIRATSRRSAVMGADTESDQQLRRASVARVFRALVAATLVTLGPDLVVGGRAAARIYPEGAWHLVGTVATFAGLLAVLLAFAALLVPVPRLPVARGYAAPADRPVPA